MVSICSAFLEKYNEDEIKTAFGVTFASLCSWKAVCKYYQAEGECYFNLYRWNVFQF